MLVHTFQHIPDIGPCTERSLWASGVQTWHDLLGCGVRIPRKEPRELVGELEESTARLQEGDAPFFHHRLPSGERWRLYREFRDRAAFLDIETTGLSPLYSYVTMVGLFNGREYKAFVKGFNLEELPPELAQYRLVVTYNGATFDLPFLEAEFGPLFDNHAHIDVRYPLRRLGHRGGLKAIEGCLGLERAPGIQGLEGRDAVTLWYEHLKGNRGALETLIRYNAEDVTSLPYLMELAYNALSSTLPLAIEALPLSSRPSLELPYDLELCRRLMARRYRWL